jgi:hypothetical protein
MCLLFYFFMNAYKNLSNVKTILNKISQQYFDIVKLYGLSLSYKVLMLKKKLRKIQINFSTRIFLYLNTYYIYLSIIIHRAAIFYIIYIDM